MQEVVMKTINEYTSTQHRRLHMRKILPSRTLNNRQTKMYVFSINEKVFKDNC